MQQIVLCEDESRYRSFLTSVLDDIGATEDSLVRPVLLFETGSAVALDAWLDTAAPDPGRPLIFLLDIALPEAHDAGLTLAERVHAHFPEAYIVFITEHLGNVFRAFRTQPFDFLPKPVTTERLAATLSSIEHHHSQRIGAKPPAPPTEVPRVDPAASVAPSPYIIAPRKRNTPPPPSTTPSPIPIPGPRGRNPDQPVLIPAAVHDDDASRRSRWQSGGPDDVLQVRSAGIIYRIRRDAIRYIHRKEERTYIHEDDRTISCSTSVDALEKALWTPDDLFVRCHRATLVNLRYVAGIDVGTYTLHLVGGQHFEIGRRYLPAVRRILKP